MAHNIKAVFRNVFSAVQPVRIFQGETRPRNCQGYMAAADPRLKSCIRCGKPESAHG